MKCKSPIIEFQLPIKLLGDHGNELSKSVRTESTASDQSRDDSFRGYAFRPGVRFDLKNTTIIPIKGVVSTADEERNATWYSREAYAAIRGTNNITVQLLVLMMIGRKNPEKFGHCYRGLEQRLPETKMTIEDELTASTRAVFSEQSRQRGRGICNPSSLRTAYRKVTRFSTDRALAAAQEDAEAAAAYQQEYASSRILFAPSTTSQPAMRYNVEKCEDLDSPVNDDDASVLSIDSAESNDNNDDKVFTTAHPVKSKGMMKRLKKFVGKATKAR